MGASPVRGLPRTFAVATMLVTVLILIDTSKCSASGMVLWKSNDTNIIAYQDPEMEFQMDSEITQRMLQSKRYVTPPIIKDRNSAAKCDRGPQRNKCTGPPSGSKDRNCRSIYSRVCPHGS